MKKKGKKPSKYKVPIFDESILNPVDDEIVRALRVSHNQEFVFERFCHQKGIVCYLPVRRAVSVHNIIQKGVPYAYSREVLRPMFPAYIFVKMRETLMHTIHDSRLFARVITMQYPQEKLLDEIRIVRTFETLGFEQELEVHTEIHDGEPFLITSGIWQGVRGELSHKDDVDKWTVKLEFCGQYVTTLINPAQFKMIPMEE